MTSIYDLEMESGIVNAKFIYRKFTVYLFLFIFAKE